ncbi:cilia- and flagella-associated protein 44 isoform X1 [Bactrocera tryoni]|uniref:cilia- and flagella-associated protein 44 isoform X1 n=1 Tax=Bactrocera tryoni TaxID=59916 RepID=UPI001A969093|nr:cilia- and flagella-associated protein 44 isoform X1 [Bactrocera tryoni]
MSEQEENEEETEAEVVQKEEPTFGEHIIDLNHSFGYDCKRFFNLVLLGEQTLVFASGDYLHYFDIPTRTVTFRKTVFGGGIGFITRNEHPDFIDLFTVAENGVRPTIFIYEYPTHAVRIKLENAAKSCFTCGSYNATGELFASQAGYPDFMLTIWRWQSGEVVLRSKSFQNNILHVHFSHFNPILLASCGLSHIKFWKMANTFTGLKLKGELGRFGKTDFSDICAIYMLPDENVISGCEWGNMLLWEGGLIKFEITRKGRKPCHTKPITRITMDEGEVTTVGMDGYVRIWYWETVDLADPPDEDRFVEIEPIYEFKVGDCEIRGLQKIKPFDKKDFSYYAQDGNGGIWFCDLNTYDVPQTPRKLYNCHGGKVVAAQASPVSTHLMTLGEDGKMFLFNYITNALVLEKKFISSGSDFIWFSTKVSSTGMDLVAGFEDGILRQLVLDMRNEKHIELHFVRAIKAHIGPITKLAINPRHTCLVVSSADKSIFVYNIKDKENNMVYLKPMGFVVLDAVVNCFNWKNDEFSTVLMGCKSGEVYEYQIPGRVTDEQTFLTYNITDAHKLKSTRFVSVKSRIRRDQKREKIKKRKEKKRQRKLVEIDKLKAANPGLQIDLETALADSEPDEEEEPLHIPAVPNPVIWLRYTRDSTIWVSLGGYDAGYIYELIFGYAEPYKCTVIADGDDCEIHSYLTIEDYLIFGLVNGKLRINRTLSNDFTDLRDYRLFPMHDSHNGIITRILPSYDGNHIFTVGHDGNIFCYNWHGPKVVHGGPLEAVAYANLKDLRADDIDDPEFPSLEQEKIYAEIKRKEEAALAHDRKVLAQIGELQVKFNDIKDDMLTLEEELILPHKNLLLDERITKQIRDELQAELDDVRDDLAYDLEVAEVGKNKLYGHFLENLDHVPITVSGISKDIKVSSFRVEKLGEEFQKIKDEIEERLRAEAAKRRSIAPIVAEEKEPSMPEPGVENFFFGRDPNTIIPRFSKKMLRLLRRYRSRQIYEVERIYTWERMELCKPDPNKNHPEDDRKIADAERNLGDYKLKIGFDYEPRTNESLTYKYIELVNARQAHYLTLDHYNKELFQLRKRKWYLYEYIEESRKRLKHLHEFLPFANREYLIPIREINMNEEYPERNLEEHCKPGCGIDIEDILYLEKKVDDLLPQPKATTKEVKLSVRDKIEQSLYKSLHAFEVDELPDIKDILSEIDSYPGFTEPEFFERNEEGFAPWVSVVRYQWLIDLRDEQSGLVLKVKNRVKDFDKDLLEMIALRCKALYEAEFMHCYMITLNQELNILRDSEEIENQLLFNADEAMKTRNEMQAVINSKNRQIEDFKKIADKLNEQILSVQQKFMSTCKGHKFFDFLRRIFKKRWRPPKPPKADDESSESSSSAESSSEDEDADAKSIDSTDMTTIRLDESHCPSGLERSTYDLAFQLRSERHALERVMLETQKGIDQRRADVAELHKKMKFHEEVYAQEKETLLVFRRKRQQELNKINISVILSMDQLQHFKTNDTYLDLSRAILFDANRLIALKERVAQLNDETQETRRLHRINVVHLRRMNTDISFMRSEITRLESEIKQEMIKKFGMIINLDELEEEVLRRYVFDLETSAEEEFRLIDKEIARKKLELANLEEELIRETKLNTEKLNILTVLHEEKNFLYTILKSQEKNFEKWMQPHKVNLDRDVEKLTQIYKEQKQTIECLEREICTLRLKSKPLQLFHEVVKDDIIDKTAQQDDGVTCPKSLASEAYLQRMEPDQFTTDRIRKIVQKYFAQWFNRYATSDNIRKYAKKATRYLAQAAHTFEGKITERILDCITQALESMMPKKYLVHMSKENLEKMFRDVLNAYDYQTSEVNTDELISGIYHNVLTRLGQEKAVLNKTQFILLRLFEHLIELLPLEEFQSERTTRLLMQLLGDDAKIDPRCINVDDIVDKMVKYARENLLDGITAMPIRRLAGNLYKELSAHKAVGVTIRCTLEASKRQPNISNKNKF